MIRATPPQGVDSHWLSANHSPRMSRQVNHSCCDIWRWGGDCLPLGLPPPPPPPPDLSHVISRLLLCKPLWRTDINHLFYSAMYFNANKNGNERGWMYHNYYLRLTTPQKESLTKFPKRPTVTESCAFMQTFFQREWQTFFYLTFPSSLAHIQSENLINKVKERAVRSVPDQIDSDLPEVSNARSLPPRIRSYRP